MIVISSILTLIICLVVLAFVAWLIESAPFVDDSFKPFIKWVLIAVAGVLVILFLLNLIGYGPGLSLLK